MHGRAFAFLVAATAALAAGGCASDLTRITDVQVRSSDRPECQLSWMRGRGASGASGTETRYDPCGNNGTFPILTSERVGGHPRH